MISSLITICGVIVIILNVKQFRQNAKNREIDIQMKKTDYDMKVLKDFADSIIKNINEFEHNCENEFNVKEFKQLEDSSKKKEIRLNIELKCGVMDIFNKLEQECVYINSDITHENVLYEVIGGVFCGFVNRHSEMLERLTDELSPFSNIHKVFYKWMNNKNIDHLLNEKRKIDRTIKNLRKKK